MKIKSLYKGIFYTLLASIFWGIPQPLIFNEIKFIPFIEVVFNRGLWSFIIILIIIIISKRLKEFFLIFTSYKKVLILSITAILILTNWTGFVLSISFNRLQDASMGYYMTPIISITLGYLFLNEKMTKLKFISVMIMFISILFLFIAMKTMPFLAILIGVTWGLYGLLRKQININAEIGLLYESAFISIVALPYLIFIHLKGIGYSLNYSPYVTIFLILTGAVTIFPLFFFNLGIKFIPLGFAGVIFFMAPTLHFVTSVFILNESISLAKLISFILIWIAVAIFITDVYKEEKTNESNTQLPN